MPNVLFRLSPAAAGGLLCALSLPAQEVLHTWTGARTGGRFGTAVAAGGDFDGDGRPDIVVGEVGGPGLPGQVHVFSGASGAPLLSVTGAAAGDGFGTAVVVPGDLTGDSVPDLVVGAPTASITFSLEGAVDVRSGADGTLVRRIAGGRAGNQLGATLAPAGDMDGDGVADFAAGVPFADNTLNNAGAAVVFSGASGEVLRTFNGHAANIRFGTSIAGAGDLDGDGVPDLVAGAPNDVAGGSGSGSVSVVSGASGVLLFPRWNGGPGDRLGTTVAVAGDVDGDGVSDLLAGAPDGAAGGIRPGYVQVRSGATGAVLGLHAGDLDRDGFGAALAGPGDVDGDGAPDILAGAPQRAFLRPGYLRLLSGRDGSVLFTAAGGADGDLFGLSAAGAGDLDADGTADLIAGAPQWNGSGAPLAPGIVVALSLVPPVSNVLSVIAAAPAAIPAAGGESAITVTAIRPDGTSAGGGLQVVIEATAGVLLGAVADLGDGRYVQTLRAAPGAAGATVSARVNGIPLQAAAAVTFLAADPLLSEVAVAPATILVGQTALVTVTPRDGAGLLLGSGRQVVVAASAGELAGPVVDNGDGTYAQTVRGAVPATATIAAAVDGVALARTAELVIEAVSAPPAVAGYDSFGSLHAFAAIQPALDRAHELGLRRIVVGPGFFEEILHLRNLAGFTLEGLEGAPPPRVRGLRIRRCADLTVRGLEVLPPGSCWHPVVVRGGPQASVDVRLERLLVHGSGAGRPGITVASGNAGVVIRECLVEAGGGDGIRFAGEGIAHAVLDSVVRDHAWAGVRIARHVQVRIAGSTITGNGAAARPDGYGILRQRTPCGPSNSALVTLAGNTVSGNRGRIVPGRSTRELGNFDQMTLEPPVP